MKIDQDLRAAINAAAKAQPNMGWCERSTIIEKSVAAFLKKKSALTKKVNVLIQKGKDLDTKRQAITDQIKKELGPFGLCSKRSDIGASFSDWVDNNDADKFTAAGGVLPPAYKGKWKAEKLIAELAAADPSKRDTILKEYGIDWS